MRVLREDFGVETLQILYIISFNENFVFIRIRFPRDMRAIEDSNDVISMINFSRKINFSGKISWIDLIKKKYLLNTKINKSEYINE